MMKYCNFFRVSTGTRATISLITQIMLSCLLTFSLAFQKDSFTLQFAAMDCVNLDTYGQSSSITCISIVSCNCFVFLQFFLQAFFHVSGLQFFYSTAPQTWMILLSFGRRIYASILDSLLLKAIIKLYQLTDFLFFIFFCICYIPIAFAVSHPIASDTPYQVFVKVRNRTIVASFDAQRVFVWQLR